MTGLCKVCGSVPEEDSHMEAEPLCLGCLRWAVRVMAHGLAWALIVWGD